MSTADRTEDVMDLATALRVVALEAPAAARNGLLLGKAALVVAADLDRHRTAGDAVARAVGADQRNARETRTTTWATRALTEAVQRWRDLRASTDPPPPAPPVCCCATRCEQHRDCCPMCPRCTQPVAVAARV